MLREVRGQLAQSLSELLEGISKEEIVGLLEVPKSVEHGHIALPVFFLAKSLRKAPPVIANELAEAFKPKSPYFVKSVQPVGGFLNFTLTTEFMQSLLEKYVINEKENLGHTFDGQGRRVVVDFASPNVAKPLHVGHLRAAMIGQAICNLAKTQGYDVIGLNHLGDWGVQFGKLARAYKKWGKEYPFNEKPFECLTQLYTRFHAEAKKNDELNKEGSLVFKKLEEGDPEIENLWKMFVDITMQKNKKLFDLLGVKHELVRGESYYNDRLKDVEKELEDKGLLKESDGAMVVELDDEMPPCLIRKADGASLYATRDIASALYRKNELKADLSLYVVAVDQNLHFKQVFKVIEKMGYPWFNEMHHISFGMYRFKNQGKMSSRKGNIVTLESVLEKAISTVKEVINEKNPDLKNKEKVAVQVGVGAIIFNDLINDRVKNVDFDWGRALDFNGDSGPYVQYCQVRCLSILNKYENELPKKFDAKLESKEEQILMYELLRFQDVLVNSFKNFKPNILASYMLDVCKCFADFYHKHRILGGEEKWVTSRIALVICTLNVLQKGLSVLNIESPEQM